MIKQLFLFIFFSISISGFSQIDPLDLGKPSTTQTTKEEEKTIIKKQTTSEKIEIPFAVIEIAPIYPGCENAGNNSGKKNCMSTKIAEHVNTKFNTNIAKNLKGLQRILVIFKIDKQGNTVNIKARSSYKILEKEAIRVVKLLPKMIPGTQRGKNVGVIYSLPITFQIQ